MGLIIKNIVRVPGIWLFGPRWVQLSKIWFMLLEYGYLVPNGCIHQNHHLCSRNVLICSLMGAIIKNIVHAPGIWLFSPKWMNLSRSSIMLLEYGYLVQNWCNYHKHCSCSWNMVIWSQMGAFIKIIICAPGMCLFAP